MAYEALAWANPTPATTDQVDGSQSYNMGTRFQSAAARNAIGVQWRVPDTLAAPGGGGTYAVAIWNIGTGTRVAYKEFTPVAGGYQDVAFDSPVALSAATNYVACVYTLHYVFRASAASTTSPSGNISSDSGMFVTYNGGAAAAPIPSTTTTTGFYVSPLIETSGDLTSSATNTATLSLTGTTQLSTTRAATNTATLSLTGTTAREGLAAATNTVGLSLTGATQLSTQRAATNQVGLSLTGTTTGDRLSTSTHTITLTLTGVSSGGSGGGQDFTSTSTHTVALSLAGTTLGARTSSAVHYLTVGLTGISSGGLVTDPEVAGMGAVYTTRERVMRAADIKATAYQATQIDLAIESSSRAIDSLCSRGDAIRPGFAPWTGVIEYDWPRRATGNDANSYRVWLGANALNQLSTMASAGVSILADSYGGPNEGPPFNSVLVDRSSNSVLTSGDASGQRSAAIGGVWCGCAVEYLTRSTWTLGSSVSASAGSLVLNAPFGVGSIVKIGTELVIVNERAWSASGQTGTLAAQSAAQTLTVSDGTAFFPDEELLLESERVWVRDISGNTLIVQRGVGGSVVAAHAGVPIQYSRTALAERGVLGTTAASHTAGAQLYIYKVPPLIEQLATAYALDQRQQESSGYARTVGSGESERQMSARAIKDLEQRVRGAYGRPVRMRAV